MIVAFRETQAPMPPVYAGPIPSLARRVGMVCVPAKREAPILNAPSRGKVSHGTRNYF